MRKGVVIVLLLLCSFALFAGGTKEAEVKRDDVVVRVEQVFNNLHPQKGVASNPNKYVLDQVYEPLIRLNDDGSLKPMLAESWDINAAGDEVTFHLRKGVKFHNGEEMKASDVAFCFNTGKSVSALNYNLRAFDRAEVVDDYTVKVYLTRPSVSFVRSLEEVYIMNEKYCKEVGDDYLLEHGCGTGPYILESVNLSSEIKLVANENYWQGAPSIKKVTMRSVTDSTTSVVSFEAGELDFMQVSSIPAYQPLVDAKRYNTEVLTTLHTAYILLNNEKAPFDNPLVRQALAYAVDKEAMVQVAYEGLADVAYMHTDERVFGCNLEGVTKYSYNPEKAKELLAEAGYPNGIDFKKDFGITMDIIAGGFYEKIATIFQQNLKDIGCEIELRASETYSPDAKSGNYEIMTQGTTFQYDFSYQERAFGTASIGGGNSCRYSNPEVDALFAKADATVDDAARAEIFHEICKIITADCPTIPVFHRKIPYAWNKNLNAVPHCAATHPYFIYEWSWN